MSKIEPRGGLRRLLPFLKEKKSEVSAELIKAKRLNSHKGYQEELGYEVEQELVIPSRYYGKDGMAKVLVMTQNLNDVWTSTIKPFDPKDYDADINQQHPLLGKASFLAASIEEALVMEKKWIEDCATVEANDPYKKDDNIDLAEQIKNVYSQRVYTVSGQL